MTDDVRIALLVIGVLNDLGVPYLITGSMASSVHGDSRSTLDADLVVDMDKSKVDQFVVALEEDFYVAREAVHSAILQRTSFKLIHFESGFKVDIFVPKNRNFDKQQLANRIEVAISMEPEHRAFVASAEDTILAKLEWYQLGGQISDRQWNDILGIMRMKGGALNKDYLLESATELGVSDLLKRAFELAV